MLPAHEKPRIHPHILAVVNTAVIGVLLVLQRHIVDYKSTLGPVPVELVVAGVIFVVVFVLLLLLAG